MNDKELLELAAKASGLGEVWYLEGFDTPYIGKRYQIGRPIEYKVWRPLDDDGDALRLAVNLGLLVDFGNAMVIHPIEAIGTGTDPEIATRRAIVLAASEIGRTMP
ncbi:hypothetical protein CJT75_06175 [Pseudomonas aeruginosa]|uniref:hypothetical protein n=1 Tax=Pseudomonas aeruginosa TaxID=287 RepID=UPI000BB9BA94|nr:hypothetical protein [Pseudomonas aeruginosa]PBX67519.1 hypothetical protein CJT75_06175 [Pseudomonas aeruginosa]PCB57757.1 hypothetical protein CJT76_26195 [Pseudomonas aeruginosa]